MTHRIRRALAALIVPIALIGLPVQADAAEPAPAPTPTCERIDSTGPNGTACTVTVTNTFRDGRFFRSLNGGPAAETVTETAMAAYLDQARTGLANLDQAYDDLLRVANGYFTRLTATENFNRALLDKVDRQDAQIARLKARLDRR